MSIKIQVNKQKLAKLCRESNIRKLWLFGSVLRDDFTPESDVDVLVRFEPEQIPGFGIFRIEEGLSALMEKRKIDLVVEEELNDRIKDHPFFQRQVIYEKG